MARQRRPMGLSRRGPPEWSRRPTAERPWHADELRLAVGGACRRSASALRGSAPSLIAALLLSTTTACPTFLPTPPPSTHPEGERVRRQPPGDAEQSPATA